MAEAYQNLVAEQPRLVLATYPSPLERVSRLEAALRADGCARVPRIFLKRDDVLSLGLGGNKIRNLEFSLGRALADGATDIVTAGRLQSNHCRLTAAACARAGLNAHLAFNGAEPGELRGNQLLCRLLGARMYYCGSDDRARRQEYVDAAAALIQGVGRQPFVIPVGGSDAVGALGHVLLGGELLAQCEALGEEPHAIVLATATGGTQAGLLAGLRALDAQAGVIGFAVVHPATEIAAIVLALAREVAAKIAADAIPADAVCLYDSELGGGYGARTPAADEAIRLLARSEGVFADPIYTGKALAGLISLVREGRFADNEAVVFVHTGGAPALFA